MAYRSLSLSAFLAARCGERFVALAEEEPKIADQDELLAHLERVASVEDLAAAEVE